MLLWTLAPTVDHPFGLSKHRGPLQLEWTGADAPGRKHSVETGWLSLFPTEMLDWILLCVPSLAPRSWHPDNNCHFSLLSFAFLSLSLSLLYPILFWSTSSRSSDSLVTSYILKPQTKCLFKVSRNKTFFYDFSQSIVVIIIIIIIIIVLLWLQLSWHILAKEE